MVFIVATSTFGKEISLNTDTITNVSEFPKEEMLEKMADDLESEAVRLYGGDPLKVPENLKREFEQKYQSIVEAWGPIKSIVKFTDGSSIYTVETPSEIAKLANIAIKDPLGSDIAARIASAEVKNAMYARLNGP